MLNWIRKKWKPKQHTITKAQQRRLAEARQEAYDEKQRRKRELDDLDFQRKRLDIELKKKRLELEEAKIEAQIRELEPEDDEDEYPIEPDIIDDEPEDIITQELMRGLVKNVRNTTANKRSKAEARQLGAEARQPNEGSAAHLQQDTIDRS